MDVNVILSLLKKVSEKYNIEYNELLVLGKIVPDRKIVAVNLELEHITVNKINYLYDVNSNGIYSSTKKPKKLGFLCCDSMEVVLCKTCE
jgi:hypothetical protein